MLIILETTDCYYPCVTGKEVGTTSMGLPRVEAGMESRVNSVQWNREREVIGRGP